MRGRRLVTPRGSGTRPPLALLRKSLFDILAPRLAGVRVLDVYAGSGSLGLESLSRGAESAVMVEVEREALRAIRDNVASLGVEERVTVLQSAASIALRKLGVEGARFGVIFLDPPFVLGAAEDAAAAAKLLEAGGIMIVRVPRGRSLPGIPGGPALVREKAYGKSRVGFYEMEVQG